jgi:hypothetical protein
VAVSQEDADGLATLANHADVAQLVEHHLAKVRVAGSNPVVRSRNFEERFLAAFLDLAGSDPPHDRDPG